MKRKTDRVDAILAQWHQERPDLDVSPMASIGRIRRCAQLLQPRLDGCFEKFGLSSWEFDVLATLRRAGAPHCLAPTALFSALMITSGTMTQRLKGLEAKGLVVRIQNAEDARSMLVQLSHSGLALIDQAVTAHVENERQILSALTPEKLTQMNALLSDLLSILEPE